MGERLRDASFFRAVAAAAHVIVADKDFNRDRVDVEIKALKIA
jgi:hypothetical protein